MARFGFELEMREPCAAAREGPGTGRLVLAGICEAATTGPSRRPSVVCPGQGCFGEPRPAHFTSGLAAGTSQMSHSRT